jgi:photosystem II stability/assembly factor-like uncharacterized protein
MHTLRRCLLFVALAFILTLGTPVQRNQAAEDASSTTYLPIAMRDGDYLYSIGPMGGSIVVMEVDPTNTSILYAGTWGSGMYKSYTSGASWTMINQGLPYLYINSLAIDPQNPSILYAGAYDHGVYKTIDGGMTWALTGPGLTDMPIPYVIAVDPVTPNVVYVGTRNHQPGPPWGGGLYKSIDGGGSWKLSKTGITEEWVYDIAIDPWDHNTLYVATHSRGVFKSVNAAERWENVNNGIEDLSTRSIVIDPTNPDIVYVGTWHYGGVFKTVNGGSLWKPAASGLYHKIYALTMDQHNPNIIYAATYRKGIMVTETGGVSWHNTGLNPDFVYGVMLDPNNSNTLYAGTMGDGFFVSNDRGENWAGNYMGFKAASITALAADWTTSMTGTVSLEGSTVITNTGVNAVYASIFGGGVYKTTDLGQSWWKINSGLGEVWVYAIAMSRTDPQRLYAATDTAGFFISTNGGLTWAANNNGLPGPALIDETVGEWADPTLRPDLFSQAFFEGAPDPLTPDKAAAAIVSILSIGVDSFDANKLYLGTQGLGLFRSTNGGVRWYTSNLKTQIVYTIFSDPFTPGLLYAGCDSSTKTLYRSTDGGANWQAKNVGITGLTVYALAADPLVPGTLYAGTSQGIYKSVDGAETWFPFGLPGVIVSSLGFSQAAPGNFYAGTNVGLYLSKDNGISWKTLNAGLVNTEITSLALAPAGARTINFFGTNGSSVYEQGSALPHTR